MNKALRAPINVFRFDVWYDAAMESTFAQDPRFKLHTCQRDAPEREILALLSRCQVYQIPSAKDEVADSWKVTGRLLDSLPELMCVSTNGAGYDTVDVVACTQAGVIVVNQSGANAQSVAEATICLMLDVSRRVTECDRRLRTDRGYSREDLMGSELFEKTLGIVGLGQIGTRVARIAAALGMHVLAHDPFLDQQTIAARGAVATSLEELLSASHVVSLHCPKTPLTTGFINAATLAQMRPGAIFINTARGGLHDERALYEALLSKRLGGAGIDVWDVEPPPLTHPLLTVDTLVALYHTAGVTIEARRRMAQWASDQIIETLSGCNAERLVNPQAWSAFQNRLQALGQR